jgi:hypothetical protein
MIWLREKRTRVFCNIVDSETWNQIRFEEKEFDVDERLTW